MYADKDDIEKFIFEEIWEFQDDANLCLEYCEEEEDFHITSYWIEGFYKDVNSYLNENLNEKTKNTIYNKYKGNTERLKEKILKKYGQNYKEDTLLLEMLASILLNKLQMYPSWYTVYGSEEEDMIDFEKYSIEEALLNEEEFPIVKLSDITAAMYGINKKVTVPEMYDIFAHYADIINKSKEDDTEKHQPIFTPDVFQVAAIVSRFKSYSDNSKKTPSEYMSKFWELINSEEYTHEILGFVVDNYINKFNTPPYGLPINTKLINATVTYENTTPKYKIDYKISGIRNAKSTILNLATEVYGIPESGEELYNLIKTIATDFKKHLVGLEKKRNSKEEAVEGKYPNKYSITHGLTWIKDLNVECKDKKRNKAYKKTPTPYFSLALAEKQSLYLIKKILRKSPENPVISCSFGIDSITTLHLVRRVTKNNFKILFNNSLIEYPELYSYKRKITKMWGLENKILETRPVKTYWKLLEENGWNFKRKGYRGKDKKEKCESSEACCNAIKHKPSYELINRLIKEGKPILVDFTGLRAAESKSREQAGKRDNVVYYSKTWKCMKVNPILFYTDEMVWEYVKKYKIEYCKIYDKILYYEDIYNDLDDDEYGKVFYKPRCGCWPCMTNNGRGYVQWLKKYMRIQYNFLMYDKKLALELYVRGKQKQGVGVENDEILQCYIKPDHSANETQISFFEKVDNFSTRKALSKEEIERYIDKNLLVTLENLITSRPCKFLS